MASDWDGLKKAVSAAVDQVALILRDPEVARHWDGGSVLPEMTVGMLAVHVVQMLSGLVAFLESEPPDASTVKVCSIPEMYGVAARLDADLGLDGAAARKVRKWAAAGAELGQPTVIEQLGRAEDRLGPCLNAASPDRLIPSAVLRGMASRLDDYLRTPLRRTGCSLRRSRRQHRHGITRSSSWRRRRSCRRGS